MLEWLNTEFNIFGVYIFRGISQNIEDGTFHSFLFFLVISVFLTKILLKICVPTLTVFIKQISRLISNILKNTIKLLNRIIVYIYSYILFKLNKETKKYKISNFNKNKYIDEIGILYKNKNDNSIVVIKHPKVISYLINKLSQTKQKAEEIFITILKIISQ